MVSGVPSLNLFLDYTFKTEGLTHSCLQLHFLIPRTSWRSLCEVRVEDSFDSDSYSEHTGPGSGDCPTDVSTLVISEPDGQIKT